jgi:hypothetical protein
MNTFLVVALVALSLGVVVAPILTLRPSARDRQLARLRASAAVHGLRVRISAGDTQFADYVLPWEPADRERRLANPFPALEKSADQWRVSRTAAASGGANLRLATQRIPLTVIAISGEPEGIAAHWHERGDEKNVEAIALALRALRDAWRQDLSL